MKSTILKSIQDSLSLKQRLLDDPAFLDAVTTSAQKTAAALKSGHAFYSAGNGGSAADAQHIVAELVGRFNLERAPLRAEALSTNFSDLTCIANDYGFEHVFSRPLQGKAKAGDVFLAISTSGNSKNVVRAAKVAKDLGVFVIGLTGRSGGLLKDLSDVCVRIPSDDIPRIQECHILVGHILCELIESQLFEGSPTVHRGPT